MKTAISIPDETFAKAEQHAAALGVSRSEFFTRAAMCFIRHLDAEDLTSQIDSALDMGAADASARAAVAAGRRRLAQSEDRW